MMRLALVVAALVLFVAAVPHQAQAQAKAGDKEVLIQGSFTSVISNSTFTNATGVFGIGYFVTSRLQIGVQPILSISSSGLDTSTTLGASTRVQWYFGADSSKVKPYAGASLIVSDFAEVGDSSFAAAIFGLKSYLSDRAALDFNGSFGFGITDPAAVQVLQIFAGISYLF